MKRDKTCLIDTICSVGCTSIEIYCFLPLLKTQTDDEKNLTYTMILLSMSDTLLFRDMLIDTGIIDK